MTPIAVAAVAWALVVGGAGGFLTEISPWYHRLKKPSWQPPDWLFGPAWSLILGLAGWSLYLAWNAAPDRGSRWLVAILFVANGLANLAWSPLFFKLRRPDWALWEVPVLWVSILLLVPYLAWVSFAAFLNLTIVRLNQPFAG